MPKQLCESAGQAGNIKENPIDSRRVMENVIETTKKAWGLEQDIKIA